MWTACETRPDGDWYLKAGMGMALRLAGEKHAYVLTDRGTHLALRDDSTWFRSPRAIGSWRTRTTSSS